MESLDAEFSEHGRTTKRVAFMVTRGSRTRRILAYNSAEALKKFEAEYGSSDMVPISVRRAYRGE